MCAGNNKMLVFELFIFLLCYMFVTEALFLQLEWLHNQQLRRLDDGFWMYVCGYKFSLVIAIYVVYLRIV